jgi:dTDP-4-dehydrorhamnose reductase
MWGILAVAIQFNASPVIHHAPPAKELLQMTAQPVRLTLPCLQDPLWALVHVTKDIMCSRMDLAVRVISLARVAQDHQPPNVLAATLESLMDQEDANVRLDSTKIRRETVRNAQPIVLRVKLQS